MQKYGLIGYPLRHSFSIGYFNEKFKAEGIDAEYINFEIPTINDFKRIIAENPTLMGLNVTIPYKEQVIPFLDELEPNTKEIGAVNVIKIIRKKDKIKLIGYNSDIIGFTYSIEPLLKTHHQNALILGTGGASKAVFHGLKNLGIEGLYVSRTAEDRKNTITYQDITPEIMESHKVIVNCTPVGMYPKVDFCPDIPYHLITRDFLLYDLLYNPNETLFMKKGKERGAEVKNGLEMLLLQAFAGWEIWNKPA